VGCKWAPSPRQASRRSSHGRSSRTQSSTPRAEIRAGCRLSVGSFGFTSRPTANPHRWLVWHVDHRGQPEGANGVLFVGRAGNTSASTAGLVEPPWRALVREGVGRSTVSASPTALTIDNARSPQCRQCGHELSGGSRPNAIVRGGALTRGPVRPGSQPAGWETPIRGFNPCSDDSWP
jgi:hypothetical protein